VTSRQIATCSYGTRVRYTLKYVDNLGPHLTIRGALYSFFCDSVGHYCWEK